MSSCVRGYHVYQEVWTPVIGEELVCRREMGNVQDRYAVGIYEQNLNGPETLVGHLPRKISLLCSLFLRHGGTITCQISNGRRHSSDLPQGGLEVPCQLIFRGEESNLKKIKRLQEWLTDTIIIL